MIAFAYPAMIPEPNEANDFLAPHVGLLLQSYRQWTGRDLIAPGANDRETARRVYDAPFVVLSHDTQSDPCFTYANRTAQTLFEMPWAEIVGLSSRLSAETIAQEERERLLARVAAQGYIDDYRGVRISRSGRRFMVQNATVWNLLDAQGSKLGQAATFSAWTPLGTGP